MEIPNARAVAAPTDRAGSREQVLEREQWLPQPPAAVFPFFADPWNLERITPPFLRFRVLRSSTPAVAEGTVIDYRLRLHGLPMRWSSIIEGWDPGRGFVDRQLRGPYRLWHHTHTFTPHRGGTLVRDRIRYRLPGGALGALLAGRLVARDLEQIFSYREAAIAAHFGAAAMPTVSQEAS